MDVVINSDLILPLKEEQPLLQGDFYQHILMCLGYAAERPPVADLLRRCHHLEGDWLIASPIHWIATHNDGTIDGSVDTLQLTDEESRDWFSQYSLFVQHDNITMYYHDAYTWLIHAPTFPQISAKPVNLLCMQSVMNELYSLDSTFLWQKLLTESQMFLNEHRLNQSRQGRVPINGIWIWGGGHFQPAKRPIFADEIMLPLAHILSSHVSLYDKKVTPPQDTLLLFNTMSESCQAALESQLQKRTVRWYWNNRVYTSSPTPWLKRIWSLFNHAN